MRKIITISLCAILLTSCETQDKKTELVGTWQAVALDAPDVEKAMQDQMNFLDTMGDHTTPEQNIEIYGKADVTSLRDSLKAVLEEYGTKQEYALEHTSFIFRADSVFVRKLNDHIDSGRWYIDPTGKLMIVDVQKEMMSPENGYDLINGQLIKAANAGRGREQHRYF